ncbi:c-type cytochrome [Defluviimonas sp. WL0002]|uniref:C-type cytochrome n=1 Tax=Albidovulum marisflavi TaxID=2984159 RepID=A0ABT2ZCK2_9RHOB|nr:c-type cytochrome [Defluviimonas sp. WL0002]MCV2868747.1 c-type cytochrome [Defluviimonas sp. WL0002]
MSKSLNLLVGTAMAALIAAPAMAEKMGLGRPALPEEIAAWDVSVLPDGTGLPKGEGDVLTGEEVFADKCASCHGEFAEGLDSWPVLAGGEGTLQHRRPVKTIGSYWPYLSTVFDYVHRSMPFGAAQTVSTDEAYAITAFLLYSNGLVEDDYVLSNENFTENTLPNADGFYPDDRAESEYPLFSGEGCMSDCGPEVKVTKRAVDLNVTPEDPDGRPAGTLPDIMAAATAAAPASEAQETSTDAPAETTETAAAEVDSELAEAGQKVFKKCAACHKVGEGAKNGTGPHLNATIGRAAGSVEGFKYSKAMADAAAEGLVWDEASLMSFLENPKGFLKGTKMSFAGLKKEEDRAAIVAYLSTLEP